MGRFLLLAALTLSSALLAGAQTPAEASPRAAGQTDLFAELRTGEFILPAAFFFAPAPDPAQKILADELAATMRWSPEKAVAKLEPGAYTPFPQTPQPDYNFVLQYKKSKPWSETPVLESLRALPREMFRHRSGFGGPFEQPYALTW